jgi:hypothetical protein
MYGYIIVEPPPLGLQLKMSESLLDLIQSTLPKPKSAAGQSSMVNIISERLIQKYVKFEAYETCANFRKIGAGWVW